MRYLFLLPLRPLSEGKVLKQKFDAIFAATRYKFFCVMWNELDLIVVV